MEAATQNRRGRPKSITRKTIEETGLYTLDTMRGAMNQSYAGMCILQVAEAKSGEESFFVTKCGNFRRQGIAEQIGRIYHAELLTLEQCKELMIAAIEEYESGKSVKEVEKHLRDFRLMLQG